MHSGLVWFGVLALSILVRAPAWGQTKSPGAQVSSAKQATPVIDEYQVPAGTALLLKLRTPLDSASSGLDDQVEATLWSPVIQNGVELIPEGSVVFGRVLEVLPANRRRPAGSIVFAFSIVEHANTGSRATVTTQRVVFAAQPVRTERRRLFRQEPLDAVIPAGTSFTAMTSQPLLVRIPRAGPQESADQPIAPSADRPR